MEAAPRITLYSAPSTASFVVHWLLIELDLPHEVRNLDLKAKEQKSPAYLKLNPAGVVPTLVLDGQVICEAAAIIMHLADLHPDADLAPAPGSPARAQYYQWLFFLANTLQPAYRAWFYPTEPSGEANVESTKAHARMQIEAAWERVSIFLAANGPFLLGPKLSVADFLMTMLMRWSRNMPKPTDTWPVLREYAVTMKARPSFKEAYARQGLSDWA
ncbi:MAG: glutathione S-transferase family protein [Polyangiaceae bacterium]